jgi:hypothetical protein
MSWCSSISVGGPLRRVFGLVTVAELGEFLELSGMDLSLLGAAIGIVSGYKGMRGESGEGVWLDLESLRWLGAFAPFEAWEKYVWWR